MTQALDTEVELNADFPLEDIIEWGSLGQVSFIGMVDVKYQKKITPQELVPAKTIDDLFKLIS